MRFKKHRILVDDLRVSYWEKNPAGKKTIIFLHGFPGNHSGLVDLANGFRNDYRLIIPDLPACRQTASLRGKHNLGNYAKWLDSFMAKISVPRAIIIAHSFGARIALVFAKNYSNRVKELVLITPVVTLSGLIVRIASLEYMTAKLLPENLRKPWLTNKFYQGAFHTIIFKSASSQRRKELISKDMTSFAGVDPRASIEIYDEFSKIDLFKIGAEIKSRSLVIAGDKDEIALPRDVQKLAEVMNAEFKLIKNSGHLVPLESPLGVAGKIIKWLERR